MEINHRNSRGLIEDVQDVAFNLQSIADHLLDLPSEEKIEALSRIKELSELRQQTIAIYAKDIDYRYHCAYKHGLMVYGILKEVIQIAKRKDLDKVVVDLLNIQNNFKPIFAWILAKYLKLPDDEIQSLDDCVKCLDDILEEQNS
jgi:hypothetical protein